MSGVKNKSGGYREGAGRKTNKKIGKEKKKIRTVYLTDTQVKKILSQYKNLTKALESLIAE